MKRLLSFAMAFVLMLTAVPMSAMAATHSHNMKTAKNSDGSLEYTYCTNPSDKTVSFSLQAYPESAHEYTNNFNTSYSYSVPNASSLELRFSSKCQTEKDYDIVTITDANGKTVGTYSGDELSGKTVSVPTGSFKISFVTDHSKTFYGFSIDSITAKTDDFTYYVPNVKRNGTNHNYSNYADETLYYICPGAKSMTVKFSSKCKTEQNYDIIYIYDSNGKQIGKYSGTQLASKTLTISGSSFSIKFTSDHSQVFYGYSIDSLTAVLNGTTEAMPNYEYSLTLPKDKYPESAHNYTNNLKVNYGYRYANAKSLKITFSSKCKTEEKYDTITIYDENGNKIGTYSGTELASKTVIVPTSSFRIEFITDHSQVFYGFSIDSIVATMNTNPEIVGDKNSDAYQTSALPQTAHNYSNYADETFYYTDATAGSLDLQFDNACKTEKNYDIVYIYDENDKLIGEYSGSDLSAKFIHIDGSSVKIRFTSDHSQTFYGYSLRYLSPNYLKVHEGSNVYSYPESGHTYNNYATETYEYYCQKPLTKQLELKFSEKTKTEDKYDTISIYGSNNKLIGTYSGTQLAGKTIKVDGSYFKIVLETDRSAAYYGFSFDYITAVQSTDSYSQKEISHNYKLTNATKPSSSQAEKMYYTCTNCGDFKQISNYDFQSYIYTLSADSFEYDGSSHRPAVTINDNTRTLTEGTDYTLTYPSTSSATGTYRITVNFKNGYSGTKYLYYTVKTKNETQQSYEDYLREQGFPESYVSKLAALHEKYPNWEFKVYNTGLDWQTAVNGERTPHSQQRIMVSESKNLPDDYLCSCSSCKGVVQDSSYAASEKAVKYYMDPRNWLDEQHVFQFETTNGGSGQTREGVESILNGTWMYNSTVTYTNTSGVQMLYDSTLKYSDIIMQAAAKSGLAPYYIASKIKQEVGAASSSYAGGSRGTVMPFQGIYNYFNIGAYNGANDGLAWAAGFLKVKDGQRANLYKKDDKGNLVLDVSLASDQRMVYITMTGDYYYVRLYAENGADKYLTGRTGYIKKSDVRNTYIGPDFGGNDQYYRPWITPYRAIIYGSKYIYNSYGIYQYTGYLQKFNVTSNQRYSHEYMVNVSSAQAEGEKIYSGYSSNGLLSSKHTFYIPVFKNM